MLHHLEDHRVGEIDRFGAIAVDPEEMREFAHRYDPRPDLLDERAAAANPAGRGLVASGWFVAALMGRMLTTRNEEIEFRSLGGAGMDRIRWFAPVRAGDRLRGERTTLMARPSASRGDRGVVTWRIDTFNQHDEKVLSVDLTVMVPRRESAAASDQPPT